MGRKKTSYPGLPAGMTARRTSKGLRFYLQRGGKKFPLGGELIHATALMARIAGGQTTPEDARFGGLATLTEAEIAETAIPINRQMGVYFLLLASRIVYVGQSIDVWARVVQHRASGRVFDAFCWQPCPEDKLDELEAYCIQKYRPPYNASKPSFRTVLKAPDLSI